MHTLHDDLFAGLGSFGDHYGTETELRNRMKDFYLTVADLRSAGVTEEEYEEFLFPFDNERNQTDFADGMYSCALTVLGKWRQMGVPSPVLQMPYVKRIGQAISDVKAVSQQYGALREGNGLGGYELKQGDAFVVGVGNNLHAILVCDVTTENGKVLLDVVEGGQGGKGNMAIRKGQYLLRKSGGRQVVRRPEASSEGRPVVFGTNLWELVLNAGLLKLGLKNGPAGGPPANCPLPSTRLPHGRELPPWSSEPPPALMSVRSFFMRVTDRPNLREPWTASFVPSFFLPSSLFMAS
jgi:hypothetical protein